ncbi:hypothetical protein NJBCHELONAE_48580 [Mycobacteroides chelonae]|uniref:phage portal protein n=1 Tax=Mycobacteroides chelonae TaxID=1774 RepID=UPI0021DBBE9B|nr:phage portal protein [Mycobacteroides chelonae]GLE59545.1 hypothetical protein NJBCHELONAE_48580 [Mycobacteroides chelonae]
MKPDKVVDSVRYIMSGPRPFEHERCDRIHAALQPWTPENAQKHLQVKGTPRGGLAGMAWRSQANFLPLVLDTYSQSMKVDNYLDGKTKDTASPWQWWQRNKMAAKQTGITHSVLKYGFGYTVTTPAIVPDGAEKPTPGVLIRPLTPRQITCMYGEPIAWTSGQTPADDDWPIYALEVNGQMLRFYDEEQVHFLGVKSVPQSALGWKDPQFIAEGNFEYIEARPHNVGVCPVVRHRDRWLLDEDEVLGIIEPLIQIQSRIDETTHEMLHTQYMTAFTQRYVAGWRPKNDEEALNQTASDTWYFSDKEVKVGQFEAGDLAAYDVSRKSAIRDLGAIAQLQASAFGVDALANISDATLAGLERGKDLKSGEIKTTLGESYEQMLRTCAHIMGDHAAAQDFDSEVVWRDMSARTYGAVIDGLVKMAAGLNVPPEALLEDVPGWTAEKVERVREMIEERREEMLSMPKTSPNPAELEGDPQTEDQHPGE